LATDISVLYSPASLDGRQAKSHTSLVSIAWSHFTANSIGHRVYASKYVWLSLIDSVGKTDNKTGGLSYKISDLLRITATSIDESLRQVLSSRRLLEKVGPSQQ
jgi:hypothetical protein